MTPTHVVKIGCHRCGCLLAWVDPSGDGIVVIARRGVRQLHEQPPEVPRERFTWWCPSPGCGRPRVLAGKRIQDTYADAQRSGIGVTI